MLVLASQARAQDCQECEEFCFSGVSAVVVGEVNEIDLESISIIVSEATGLNLLENQVVAFTCARGCAIAALRVGDQAMALVAQGSAAFVYEVNAAGRVELLESLSDDVLTVAEVRDAALANEDACLIVTRDAVDPDKCDEQLQNCCACVRSRVGAPLSMGLLVLFALVLARRRTRPAW